MRTLLWLLNHYIWKKNLKYGSLLLSTILNIKVTLFLKVSITITGNFYVEDGSAEISFSNKKQAPVTLQKGELFIQSPNEYYSFRASSGNIAVLFTAGFYSDTANLSLLANKKLVCQKKETELLQALALEGKNNFSPKINPASPAALERKYNQPFGGEQLIGIYLEMLLISLMRQSIWKYKKRRFRFSLKNRFYSFQPNHRLLWGTYHRTY